MRAVRCNQHGLPDTLTVETLPDLHPEAGEIVIDVKAASVNFPDVLIIQNKYQFKPPLPFTPGAELAGIVREVGAGVTRVKPGMRVAAYTAQGAFAQQARARETDCVVLPDDVNLALAAAFTLAYGTSYHALVDRGALKSGETLLVLGAAGGVGVAAIQIGKILGARVIAAASSAEKLAFCREQGADEIIDYRNEDLRERVKALTHGQGPDVIFDPVGGAYAEPAFRSIGWRGRYLVVGFANGEIPKLPLNLALLKGASIVGVFWGDHMRREHAIADTEFATMVDWIKAGKLLPVVTKRYPLDATAQALDDMMNRRVTGKIVIEP
ncbi:MULTISPECIES: NADPH:quinone oxidoreductase family protein [unclassified Caballeronia]|uniref:NADPH:quinone oxidoreductase family protein n=1 Tax=unclassified Caballeronia TaxID=2646786 RepID=UPI0028648748|nr:MULTISPECIES: NADPH:quinone oxidoreductase family protein [unclassified Caballeronia]MDR5771740.1 NADPH:quinone oxidoreductase family protein [Caballeronia sp. LZ002]MDR5847175.1 NADPH:quinone oxidoreductase family protein [Caballeronia sp. LZ003]